MLHAWEKYEYENAEKEFHARYLSKSSNRNPAKKLPKFFDVLKGKIEFVGMVRGKTDPLYIHYLKKLRKLAPDKVRGKLLDVMDAIWVLESEDPYAQGTGFMLKGYGLVTCYHVLRPGTCAFRADKPEKKFSIEVIEKDSDLDVAVLKIDDAESPYLEPEDGDLPRTDDWTVLAGFPKYSPHTTGVVRRGRVIGYYRSFEVMRMLIETPIIYGNSGGPVLNHAMKVVGIAAKGASSLSESHRTDKFEVIPVGVLRTLMTPSA
jgi:S1-C subfamily serine protease